MKRRVELAMEGERIFDLLRWDAVKDVFGDGKQIKLHFYSDYLPETSSDKLKSVPGLTKYQSDHILFPIPQYEMDQNKAIIENNPGLLINRENTGLNFSTFWYSFSYFYKILCI